MIGRTNAVMGGSGGVAMQTITFTVEGAKGDNISVIDYNGAIIGNIIFDTGATSAEYTMYIPVGGGFYTFISSIAKDIDDITADYRKEVILNEDTTLVKVMPDGNVLYWYGYNEDLWTAYKIQSSATLTKNSNNFYLHYANDTSGAYSGFFRTNNAVDVSGYTKLKRMVKAVSGNGAGAFFANATAYTGHPSGTFVSNPIYDYGPDEGVEEYREKDISYSGSLYQYFPITGYGIKVEIYALWYE